MNNIKRRSLRCLVVSETNSFFFSHINRFIFNKKTSKIFYKKLFHQISPNISQFIFIAESNSNSHKTCCAKAFPRHEENHVWISDIEWVLCSSHMMTGLWHACYDVIPRLRKTFKLENLTKRSMKVIKDCLRCEKLNLLDYAEAFVVFVPFTASENLHTALLKH